MRTKTEIKLMNLRQKYKDILVYLKAQPVIPLKEYQYFSAKFLTCETVLMDYRLNNKYQDIA